MHFQIPPDTSQSWADKILWMFGGGVLTSIPVLVKLIFYRKKPASEIARIDAETERSRVDTAVKLSDQLLTLHDRMNLMESNMDNHQRETAETIRYYQGQIKYFEKLDMAYRNRSHDLCGELGRLTIAIANLETAMTEQGISFARVQIRTSDEIFAPWPLPEPPE